MKHTLYSSTVGERLNRRKTLTVMKHIFLLWVKDLIEEESCSSLNFFRLFCNCLSFVNNCKGPSTIYSNKISTEVHKICIRFESIYHTPPLTNRCGCEGVIFGGICICLFGISQCCLLNVNPMVWAILPAIQ